MSKAVTTIARKASRNLPVARSEEIVESILDDIMDGESLRAICSKPKMPTSKTFFKWVEGDEKLRDRYNLALESRAHLFAEELISLADTASQPLIVNGNVVMRDGEPVMVVTSESIAHAKLKVNTRQWVISKLLPKKYGDKIDVTSEGKKVDPVLAIIMAVQGSALPVVPQGTVWEDDDDD